MGKRQEVALTWLLLALAPLLAEAAELQPDFASEPEVAMPPTEQTNIELLLPNEESLFKKEAVDEDALQDMDCHLRNVDYCYAGILGTAQRVMPESDSDLETRCDEMRAASSCMAVYNDRCGTFKVFSALMPMAGALEPRQLVPAELQDARLPEQLTGVSGSANTTARVGDLMGLCDPQARGSPMNVALRRRLFQLGACINGRLPELRPCVGDLKAAIQLLYEPGRNLPLKPSCCAIARFRECASGALDNVCGLSSYKELESSLAEGSNKMLGTRLMDRVCRQALQSDGQPSAECDQLLPPKGLKVPQRRGRKASKLAKALELFSF